MSASLLLNPLAAAAEVKTGLLPASTVKINSQISQAKFPLDKAIEKAKTLFNIGDEYDRFESSMNSSDGRAEWYLRWERSGESENGISVQVDAANGDILSMYLWGQRQPEQKFNGIPKYSYRDAAKLAEKWAQKLAPAYYVQTKPAPEKEHPVPLGSRRPVEYSYYFQRVVNGIAYPDDSIYVCINADTGELKSYRLEWNENQPFPSPAGKISARQAEKIFARQVELVYFQPRVYKQKEPEPVKLVYRVKGGSSLFIDALAGKVIKSPFYGLGDEREMKEFSEKMNTKQELSPAEQAEVDKLKSIITAEKARERAEKTVKIPSDQKLSHSRLNKNYRFPKQMIWSFRWKGENGSTEASIDAATGELISFYKWNRDLKSKKSSQDYGQLSREQAQKIAEDYIRQQQPRRCANIRLENTSTDEITLKGKKQPRRYRFSFVRLVNGIPFPGNGFDVQVDSRTGEVTSYCMNWWDVKFPAAAGSIDRQKAVNTFLAAGDLTLEYRQLYQENKKEQVHLVYHWQHMPSYMLDAKTGKFLNWRGKPLPPQLKKSFTDISGHRAEKDIKLLTRANIIKSSDDKFYPDKEITKLEVLAWLVASRHWSTEIPYRENKNKIVDSAIRLGIIEQKDAVNLDSEVTRLELAQLMINTLDYDGAAKLKDIYVLKTRDADTIPDHLKGYAALSMGLHLQSAIDGNYLPNKKVTRGSAATALVQLLKVEK